MALFSARREDGSDSGITRASRSTKGSPLLLRANGQPEDTRPPEPARGYGDTTHKIGLATVQDAVRLSSRPQTLGCLPVLTCRHSLGVQRYPRVSLPISLDHSMVMRSRVAANHGGETTCLIATRSGVRNSCPGWGARVVLVSVGQEHSA